MALNLALLFLLAVVVYAWAQETVGKLWALLPAAATAISPQFITQSPLPSLALLLAVFSFFSFVFYPQRLRLILAGAALGAAQLTTPAALFLFPYMTLAVTLFYLLGVVRDWSVTKTGDRWHRFGVRCFLYFRSVVFIFIIAAVTIVAANTTLSFAGSGARFNFQQFIQYFQFQKLAKTQSLGADFLLRGEPPAELILGGLAALVALLQIPRVLRRPADFVPYLAAHFSWLALLLFGFFVWRFSQSSATIIPVAWVLLTAPLASFMAAAAAREVRIIIVHERFSFSAKWLVLAALLSWYVLDSLYRYYLQP